MDLDPASLRAGSNYLHQPFKAPSDHRSSLILPSALGADIAHPTEGTTEPLVNEAIPAEGSGAKATVLSIATCPAAPDLLALSHSEAAAVQLWQLPQCPPLVGP